MLIKKIAPWLAAGVLFGPKAMSKGELKSCDLTSYEQVFSACYTGRAAGFYLPANDSFAPYPGMYTESWDYGAYDDFYQGPYFSPYGSPVIQGQSILPPYNWGAIGQICDVNYDPSNHRQCEKNISLALQNPRLNARYKAGQFYWKGHGHNCHDAAEDIGLCLLNASEHMPSGCDLTAAIVVWDGESDVARALGNVYHSQVLVQKKRWNSNSQSFESVICLTESQQALPGGIIDDACCSTNMRLVEQGSYSEYADAFGQCPALFVGSGAYPYIYDVRSFRKQRQTGTMDVESSYDVQAGRKALQSPRIGIVKQNPMPPVIVGVTYDSRGVPLQIDAR